MKNMKNAYEQASEVWNGRTNHGLSHEAAVIYAVTGELE